MMTEKDVLKFLQKVYPDYNFSSGYIGNCGYCGGKYIDDRSYRVWCKDVYEEVWDGTVQSMSIKLGSKENMDRRSPREWMLLLMNAVKRIERGLKLQSGSKKKLNI